MLQMYHVFEFLPPNFICKCSALHCRRNAPTLFPYGKQPGGYYPPLRRRCHRISWAEISMRCRGGAPRSESKSNDRRGDHTIIQRIVSARQRGKFLSRTATHPPGHQCCKCTMFWNFYRRISFANVWYCIVSAMRRRCFPMGNNRAADSRPYADGATEFPGRILRGAGRAKPAPWLSLWESWHGAAVTERVPCSNQRIFP